MSLQKTLQEIKKLKPIAEEDVEAGNVQTLNARRGRQKAAVERLKQLKDDYSDEMLRSAMFVIAVGASADDFALACEPFSGFVSNPENFYTEIASRVSPELYQGKPTVSNLFDVMGRHLEDKMREMGISSYPQMIMNARYARTISNSSEFASLVKQAINEQVGTEIVGIHAVNSTVDRAIERDHDGSTTLMVLPTHDEGLAADLIRDLPKLTRNVFVVAAGKSSKSLKDLAGSLSLKNVTEDSVKEVLKTIKNMRK